MLRGSEMAIVGGTNLILEPESSIAFSSTGMLAADGHCKFGDASADGFVRSDGIGVVVLKPLAEALRDALEHVRTRVEVTAERVVLEELNGGCIAPIGVHALVQGDIVRTAVQVFNRDGSEQVGETRELDAANYAEEARELAADLRDRGAAELVEEARREA